MRRHLDWNTSIFLLSPSVIFHVWLPNSTTGWTSELNSFTLVLSEYTEEFHVLFSLRNVRLPLFGLAPRLQFRLLWYSTHCCSQYVNSSTSSMFIPFTSIGRCSLLFILISLVFFALIFNLFCWRKLLTSSFYHPFAETRKTLRQCHRQSLDHPVYC